MGVVNGCSLGDGTTNDATYFSSAKAFAAELPAENRGIRTPAIQFRVSVLSEGEIKRGWALRGAFAFTSRRNSSVVPPHSFDDARKTHLYASFLSFAGMAKTTIEGRERQVRVTARSIDSVCSSSFP